MLLGLVGGGILGVMFVPPIRQDPLPPAEYLYLDDDRVSAYLGQLNEGLAPTESRSRTDRRTGQASVGPEGVAQVGGSVERTEKVDTVVTRSAADRFYTLHQRLASDPGLPTVGLDDPEDAKKQIEGLEEGDFVRIDATRVAVPTFALALPRLATAQQFRLRGQRRKRGVTRRGLAGLSARRPTEVERYLNALGPDPRVPLRAFAGDKQSQVGVFIPVRYSKLTDSPSLLSGRLKVLGKVARVVREKPKDDTRLTSPDKAYFDTEIATLYERVLRERYPAKRSCSKAARRLKACAVASEEVRRKLNLPTDQEKVKQLVAEAATQRPFGLVVLPVAIYS